MVLIEDVHVVAGFADAGEAGGRERRRRTGGGGGARRTPPARRRPARWLTPARRIGVSGGDAEISVPAANDAVAAQSAASTSGSGDGYFAGMLDTILGNWR